MGMFSTNHAGHSRPYWMIAAAELLGFCGRLGLARWWVWEHESHRCFQRSETLSHEKTLTHGFCLPIWPGSVCGLPWIPCQWHFQFCRQCPAICAQTPWFPADLLAPQCSVACLLWGMLAVLPTPLNGLDVPWMHNNSHVDVLAVHGYSSVRVCIYIYMNIVIYIYVYIYTQYMHICIYIYTVYAYIYIHK